MTLRRQGAMVECETRTQEALVAALRARPRTPYCAGQCILVAKASFFNSLLDRVSTMALEHSRVRAGEHRSVVHPLRRTFQDLGKNGGGILDSAQ